MPFEPDAEASGDVPPASSIESVVMSAFLCPLASGSLGNALLVASIRVLAHLARQW
jgi:hypothetical protein